MKKWYENKTLLNAAILIMIVGFIAYILRQPPQMNQLGLVIFLTAGTLIMIRGVVKITMRMRGVDR
ncbi:hypothetical protein IH992_18430 [Candidatus Poribacteria bacterium]|nr:hypothetical protein [Candidatus Poribacteria bacterium]